MRREISEAFKQYYHQVYEKYKMPGIIMGLAQNGELLWEQAHGYRDVENELSPTTDTVFGIGSVTKSFTCVAIMQLQEAGKLSVQDPVIQYIPEFKTPNEEWTKQMTIHHFMTHTTGLPPLPTLFSALKKSMENDPLIGSAEEQAEEAKKMKELVSVDTYEEMLTYMAKLDYDLLGPPGEEFSYSNDCYALLGTIIERVSGQSYEDYMKEHILSPAGMDNSVFHLEELKDHHDVALLYNSQEKDGETLVYKSNNPWDAPAMRAAGFLKSTVNDMLKYTEVFRNSGKVGSVQIISSESVEQMCTPFIECGPGKYYGYGFMITPDFFGYKLVEHGGAVKGVAAQINIIPEIGLTGVSLTNLGGVPSSELLHRAFKDYLGRSIDAEVINFEEIALSEDILQEYEGEFISNEGMGMTFFLKDGKLNVSSESFTKLVSKPVGDDLFIITSRESNMPVRFVRDEEGKITRVSFGFRQIEKMK